ncbi:MAG: biopolymer transporter ExbD [bacterium]
MFKFKRTTRLRPFVDFTPLIDCAFTMLIFFAVSMTMISARTGMKINLPEKSDVEKLPQYVQISVKADPAGSLLYFQDQQVTKDTLPVMVRDQITKDPESSFIIAAEPNIVYSNVVDVVDIVNRAGGTRLALQINQKTFAKSKNTK